MNKYLTTDNKQDKITHIFTRAEEAQSAGDLTTALNLYTSILEIDANNHTALHHITMLQNILNYRYKEYLNP